MCNAELHCWSPMIGTWWSAIFHQDYRPWDTESQKMLIMETREVEYLDQEKKEEKRTLTWLNGFRFLSPSQEKQTDFCLIAVRYAKEGFLDYFSSKNWNEGSRSHLVLATSKRDAKVMQVQFECVYRQTYCGFTRRFWEASSRRIADWTLLATKQLRCCDAAWVGALPLTLPLSDRQSSSIATVLVLLNGVNRVSGRFMAW